MNPIMITSRDLSTKAIKYLLFIFNLMFVVTGIILLITGVTIKAFFKEYEPFFDDKYLSVSSLLIFAGSVIFVIAFFGCCGALKENRYMILAFSFFLALIMILELCIGISGYVMSDKSSALLNNTLNQSMYQYNKSMEMAKLWDTVQTKFECCGVNSNKDWLTVLNNSLPVSCCSFTFGTLTNFTCTPQSKTLYQIGCEEKLGLEVTDHFLILCGVALGIVLSQILGVLFSCCLAKSFRASSYESV